MTKGTEPSRMKIWVTAPEKARPDEVLAEGGKIKCVVEEEDQLRPHDQLGL